METTEVTGTQTLEHILTKYNHIQEIRVAEYAAIEVGEHGDYRLVDELRDDIADLLIDHANELLPLLAGLKKLDRATNGRLAADADRDNLAAHDAAVIQAAVELTR